MGGDRALTLVKTITQLLLEQAIFGCIIAEMTGIIHICLPMRDRERGLYIQDTGRDDNEI